MKKITIKIKTENAAFEGSPEIETARILRELAKSLEFGSSPESLEILRDYNGNRVGNVIIN